uniref:Uncharacterized protein n=1 Tax=uncultured prokaryote TaxID=198431 RepID=A0A0H5Q2W4_9ZZZZ|nr:hypothetical protein [uncultured prokaryote]
MPLNEVLIDWLIPGGQPGVSVLYYTDSTPANTSRTALGSALTAMKTLFVSGVQASIRTEGRVIDEVTGGLTGAWADPNPISVAGTGPGNPVPNASMVLLQAKTGQVVKGRFLQGRTYLPGLPVTATSGGEVATSPANTITSAFNGSYLTTSGAVIWSRPGPKGPGTFKLISSYTVWRELAVLRHRR